MEENKLITEMTLLNGETVPIASAISLFDWKRAKKDGLFTQNAFAQAMRNGGEGLTINDKDIENAPFVAYRAAGGSLSQPEFNKLLPFDLELAGRIYSQIVRGGKAKKA